MPFTPFKKGTNSHTAHAKGSPKPAPAGPGGKFDSSDSPGQDENGDGIFGRPEKSQKKVKGGAKPTDKAAFAGLKAAKPY